MSELSFLLSLLLDQKLSKAVQLLIKDRIKEIEVRGGTPVYAPGLAHQSGRATSPTNQAPSTQKILDEMAAVGQTFLSTPTPQPTTVEQIAQTPAAAAALASRQQAITQALTGNFDKNRTSPRKF